MKTRQVLVTGANGQLGRALQQLDRSEWKIVPFSSDEMDVTNWTSVLDRVSNTRPDLIIHAAAATNVDRCEREPTWAFEVNALGSRHVARAAALVDADLVYVSTNYVFDGSKAGPYHEFDTPNPISVYGESKLAGEIEATRATSRCFVVRTASVFDRDGRNFVNTMRGLMERLDRVTVVNDQTSNPTYASDLAEAIANIVDRVPYGTYHVTNSGTASWYDWACEVRRIIGSGVEIDPIPASAYQRDATPPANGTMESLALPRLGISVPGWRDALERCLTS